MDLREVEEKLLNEKGISPFQIELQYEA
jgi:hypothetical protein